jgi:PTH1 family peptidyl-tRNA hydrolase
LADVWHFERWRKDGKAKVSSGAFGGTTVRLVKPLTYVNLSGAVLRPYLRRTTWNPAKDLLVIADDVALPLGRFRLRARGSNGGHNGLRSVEEALQSREYARMRIGVGPPPERRQADNDLADFVLAPFGRAEREVVNALKPRLADAAETWLRNGIETAMNAFNRPAEITSQ